MSIIFTVMLGIVGINKANASSRINLNSAMEKGMTRNRKVEIDGKIFDVLINLNEKSITIKGYVNDWDEMDKVEKYFKHRGPSNYQLKCELDFLD